VLLGKQFNQVLKKMNNRPRSDVQNMSLDIRRNANFQRRVKSDENDSQTKGVQCFECEGYGHVKPECPTYLKKQKKGYSITWSDEDSEEDKEGESTTKFTAFIGRFKSGDDSSDEEITFEELFDSYRKLCVESEGICKVSNDAKKVIAQMEEERKIHVSTIANLQSKVTMLSTDLQNMTKHVKMLNIGTSKLDEILQLGKRFGDVTGIGFTNTPTRNQVTKPVTKFVSAKGSQNSSVSRHRPRHYAQQTKTTWRCHYCGKKGHIRPFCFKLYGYPKKGKQVKPKPTVNESTKEWRVKKDNACLLVHTCKAAPRNDWYFDSGCSKHMTGRRALLTDLKPNTTRFVTYGDGEKGEVRGSGNVMEDGHPKLDNVLLVEGLHVNLISIGQLCDQGLKVTFNKFECYVTDSENKVIMKGKRGRANCYIWTPPEYEKTCDLMSELNEFTKVLDRLSKIKIKEKTHEDRIRMSSSKLQRLPRLKTQAPSHENPGIHMVSESHYMLDHYKILTQIREFLEEHNVEGLSPISLMARSSANKEAMNANYGKSDGPISQYNVTQDVMTSHCNNVSVIIISKNPIQHSRTKHIGHHFVRDLVKDKVVDHDHIDEQQLEDIYTNVLNEEHFD
jgi:hypothetical protein